MPPRPATNKQHALFSFAIATAALLLAAALLLLMLWRADLLVQLGLVGQLWFPLLLLLGLASATALFAGFKSHAQFTGTVYGGTLQFGGPAVVMLLVPILGFSLAPKPSSKFDLTIYLHGPAGHADQVLKGAGKLTLHLGNDPRSAKIGGNFRLELPGDLPDTARGVAVHADGYQDQRHRFEFDSGGLPIRLEKAH